MLEGADLAAVLAAVALRTVAGPWDRAVSLKALQGPPPGAADPDPQPLWPGGAKQFGARYVPRGAFEAVHVSGDPLTALAERRAVFLTAAGEPRATAHEATVLVSVSGTVPAVLDLTADAVRAELGTSLEELCAPDWAYGMRLHELGRGPMPATQRLGLAAFRSRRIAGLQYPSARRASGVNLVVFTARLAGLGRGFLEVSDPEARLVQRLS